MFVDMMFFDLEGKITCGNELGKWCQRVEALKSRSLKLKFIIFVAAVASSNGLFKEHFEAPADSQRY